MLPPDLHAGLETLVAELGQTTVGRALATLTRDLPRQLAELRAQADARDQDDFKRIAHTLKGRCAMLGLEDLRQAAYALEQASQDHDSRRRLTLLVELELKAGDLIPGLLAFQAELAARAE